MSKRPTSDALAKRGFKYNEHGQIVPIDMKVHPKVIEAEEAAINKPKRVDIFDEARIDPRKAMEVFLETGYIFKDDTPKQPDIFLVVLGEPKAQKRHRTVNMGKFNRQYDPSASDKKDFLSMVQDKAPEQPFDCPLELVVNFYFTRPKSHYKTGKNAHILKDNAPTWHTSKPDSDNLFKMVSDSLNKIFWRDDSLLCKVTINKMYDLNPRIEINVTKL